MTRRRQGLTRVTNGCRDGGARRPRAECTLGKPAELKPERAEDDLLVMHRSCRLQAASRRGTTHGARGHANEWPPGSERR
jgi:hypothetical protein